MSDDINPPDKAKEYRWRPAVAPFRPHGIPRIRPRKPLPGQMALPGIEPDQGSPETAERADQEGHPIETAEAHGRSPDAEPPEPTPACPNCGATEFDEDGDCIQCWEPGVGPVHPRPKSKDV